MKRIIVVVLTICGIISASCSKTDKCDQAPSMRKHGSMLREGGEDDDRIIVIHRVVNSIGVGIGNVSIVYMDAGSIASGITDNTGTSVLSLPYAGTWNLNLTCNGYHALSAQVHAVDSVIRVDTLYTE